MHKSSSTQLELKITALSWRISQLKATLTELALVSINCNGHKWQMNKSAGFSFELMEDSLLSFDSVCFETILPRHSKLYHG